MLEHISFQPSAKWFVWAAKLILFMCKALAIALDISHIHMLLDCITEFAGVKF